MLAARGGDRSQNLQAVGDARLKPQLPKAVQGCACELLGVRHVVAFERNHTQVHLSAGRATMSPLSRKIGCASSRSILARAWSPR